MPRQPATRPTLADPATPPPPAASGPPLFGPALLWLCIQLAVLVLISSRLPFSAPKRFPQPAELLALRVMLSVQIIGSALFFPLLMASVTTAVMTMAITVPFVVVAAFFAGDINRYVIGFTVAYVMAWLLGLGCWSAALRSRRARAVGIAVAVFVVIAGPLAWYLRAEFRLTSDAVEWPELANWGPVFGAMVISEIDRFAARPWLLMGGHVLLGTIVWGITRLFRRAHR